MKLKAVILDDSLNDIKLLEMELKSFPVIVEKRFNDPARFLEEESKIKYDILFLDMNMPGLKGSDVIAKIKKQVILITGESKEFASPIIDMGVDNRNLVCVLNKPINQKRLAFAFEKLQEKNQKTHLEFNTIQGKKLVNVNDIELITSQDLDKDSASQGESKIIYLKNKAPLFVNSLSLKDVFINLNSKVFLLANRYDIININCIKGLSHDTLDIEYTSAKGVVKPTSRTLGKEGKSQYDTMM